MKIFHYAVIFALVLFAGSSLAAAIPQQSLAFNPVFVPFGTANAEYEHALFTPKSSLGVAGWYEFMDVKARWCSVRALYYPFTDALDGFGFGLSAGVMQAFGDEKKGEMKQDLAPVAGVIAQYNWLLGADKHYLIGIGMGATVTLKSCKDDSPLNRFDGFLRLVAGYAL